MAKEMIMVDQLEEIKIIDEKMDMFEALALLERENLRLIENRLTGSCCVHLYDRKDQLLFSLSLQFPLANDIEEVLSERLLQKKSETFEERTPENKVKKEPTSEESNLRRKKRKNSEADNNKEILLFHFFRIPYKLFIRFGVFFFASILLFVGWKVMPTILNEPVNQNQEEIVTWNELVKNHQFLQAAEKFPKKRQDLVDYLTKNKEFSWLEKINEKYPTKTARFDLAFYHEDWESVVKTDVDLLSEDRQVMLAHAYIQLHQLKEAELLNKRLKSELLSEEIDQLYLSEGVDSLRNSNLKAAAQYLNKISNSEMKKTLQTYIDNATIIMDFIALYKENKDTENQKIWERKLNELGVELTNDETF